MKHLYTLTFLLCFLFACRKADHKADNYLTRVQTALKDSVSSEDYSSLDFSRSVLSKVDSADLYLLRIPFTRFDAGHFLLLQTTKEGTIRQGRITEIRGAVVDKEGIKKFQGHITIRSLQRKLLVQSSIKNGFITAFHQNPQGRSALVQPSNVLPEVVVTYVIPSGGGISWSTWIWLQSLFNGFNVQPYYSFFNSDTGDGGSWSGGGGSPTGGGDGGSPTVEQPILIDFENQDENSGIDIEKFINCLSAIPDAGATCSIEILSDIPVDKDPNKIFDLGSRSPGHTFINIRKQNGSQSASQNIGFYPNSGLKSILTNAPIDGKFVDNGLHEFNCGFKINITAAQLQAAIVQMQRTKSNKYDIDNYNCTDWAMDVFNAAGGNFQIPLYDIPGNYPSVGTRMPNGVYAKLKEMKNANDPRAGDITIDIVKGWAGYSAGPCN